MNAQRGVALVTALLIVSLASIIAVSMAQRMQLDIRRTGNLLAVERGYQYARGLELWAIEALRLDGAASTGSTRTAPTSATARKTTATAVVSRRIAPPTPRLWISPSCA